MTRTWLSVFIGVLMIYKSWEFPTEDQHEGKRDIFVKAVTTGFEKAFMINFLNNCTGIKHQFGIDRAASTDAVRLELWRGNAKQSFRLDEIPLKLNASKIYDANLSDVIFIHGFLSSSRGSPSMRIVKELMNRGQHNVFTLDSSSVLKTSYLTSTIGVYDIGQDLGKNLALSGINGKNIHLIGHSLGAHTAGFAGKFFEKNSGNKVARISGLDPAGPCYFHEEAEYRLSRDDADYVDVIHTNMGVYGYMNSIGDIDFFPNNGEKQPGCENSNCSHARSWELYAESIKNPKAFPAIKCENWIKFSGGKCIGNHVEYMGFDLNKKSAGKYYLRTDNVSPYSLGEGGIKSLNAVELLMYWFNMMHMP